MTALPSTLPRSRTWIARFGLVFVVLAMGLALSAAGHVKRLDSSRPNTFLNRSNLVENVATPMSYYAIRAVGVSVVIIGGGIDISVGSIMGLSAIMTAWFIQRFPANASAWTVLPVALGLPVLIGISCGLINGLLIALLRIHPFIVTLGTLSIFRGLATVLPPQRTMPAQPLKVPVAFTDEFMRYVPSASFPVRVVPLVFVIAITAVGVLFLKRLVPGVQIYAIGGNEEASRLAGLPVARLKIMTYAISGACAGIAGAISLGNFGSASATTASGYELTVIASAVVGGASLAGGRGTAIGALLGALVIGLIENGISILQWNQEYRLIIIGAAIIVAVSLDRLSEALGSRAR